ncbi:ammonium transporter [Streptomyces sp. HNA39]|nr:ammonium transporter [Streptomyces sp. HNA39]UQA37560.1 ammonium transporter [Streptomyces sp. HNA39]
MTSAPIEGGGWALLGKQLVAIAAVMAFSSVLTWHIAKAVDRTVGFRATEEYAGVSGREEERAYDFRTAWRLEEIVAGKAASAASDEEIVRQISRLLRDRQASR